MVFTGDDCRLRIVADCGVDEGSLKSPEAQRRQSQRDLGANNPANKKGGTGKKAPPFLVVHLPSGVHVGAGVAARVSGTVFYGLT